MKIKGRYPGNLAPKLLEGNMSGTFKGLSLWIGDTKNADFWLAIEFDKKDLDSINRIYRAAAYILGLSHPEFVATAKRIMKGDTFLSDEVSKMMEWVSNSEFKDYL